MKAVEIKWAWNGESGPLFPTLEKAMANRPGDAKRLFKVLISDTHILSVEEEPTTWHHGDGDE